MWTEFCAQEDLGALPGSVVEVIDRVAERLRESEAGLAAGCAPSYRVVVAVADGELIGFASLSVVDRGLLTASCAVLVDVVHVVDGQRKRGVGTALLREAVLMADEVGASDVVVNTPPRGRDVNRFYARLGFAPMVVRRSSTVSALRRRLGVEPRHEITAALTPAQRSLRRRALLAPRRAPMMLRTSDGRAAGR
jgi:GNAT superfamily N-acetyltransferase